MNSDMVKPEKFRYLHLVYHFTVPLKSLVVSASDTANMGLKLHKI